jgi:hypothetical protein
MARHIMGWRAWLATLAASALVACGGGGGGDDNAGPSLEAPPTVAATLSAGTAEASSAAVAAVVGAQRVVELDAGVNGNALPLGSSNASPAMLARRALVATTRERALAVQTLSCTDFFGAGSCSGSVTVDTNASGNSTVVPAGTYLALSFNELQGSFGGSPLQLDGTLRIDFLTSADLDDESPANARFTLTLMDFEGNDAGVVFGPFNEVALFEFDSAGEQLVTVDGLRIGGLDTLTVTDDDNYTLANVRVRRAHWTQVAAYVDVQFTGWSVIAGRPTVNSRSTISAGSNGAVITVQTSSAQTVVYRVVATIGGVVTTYDVTASYPAGGGAPTYTVQPIAT